MTLFGRTQTERREQREAERERNLRSLCTPSRSIGKGSYAGSTAGAAPKTEPKRNRALLDMAYGRECLLCPEGQCICPPGSVVACHSNLSIHGKAKGRKADDHWSVWGGSFAHEWLDRSAATASAKAAKFMLAHGRQVLAWQRIASDPSEPERFRKAAQWALDQLATAREQQGAKA